MSRGATKKELRIFLATSLCVGKSFAACESLAHNGISVLNWWQFLLSCDFHQHNFMLLLFTAGGATYFGNVYHCFSKLFTKGLLR